MNTATQLGNAQQMPGNPLLQPQEAAGALPAQAIESPTGYQQVADPEELPFEDALQTLLATLDFPPSSHGEPDDNPSLTSVIAPEVEGVEQAEALLGLFTAQQQQQVIAQQIAPAPASVGSETLSRMDLPANNMVTAATPPQAKASAPLPRVDNATVPSLQRTEVLPVAAAVGEGVHETLQATSLVRPVADSAAVTQVSAGSTVAAATMDRAVRLEGNDAQRGEQMLQALRSSVQLQLQQSQQVATIRLDPPELGNLEIQVTQDSGKISIQISATQADTLRLLQQTSDRLRLELLTQQLVQVNVQVGGEGHSGQSSRQNQEALREALVRGNPLDDSDSAHSHAGPRDVLATV